MMGLARRALVAFWVCAAGASVAGSLTVTPVRLTLAAGRTAGVLTVVNNDSEPTVVQLQVVRWIQVGETDQLEATRELLATPPIFTVPAGGSQVVRIGLRGEVPSAPHETTYRLLLREVRPAPAPGIQGVRMELNISMPVFVVPALLVGAVPVLRWQARRVDGALWLRADNHSPLHVQVIGLRLNGGEPLPRFGAGYVLPGAHREWKVSEDVGPTKALSLVALTDAGELVADVEITAP